VDELVALPRPGGALRRRPRPSITQERWRDTWFLSTGTEYRATNSLTLRAGAAWDKSPVREATRTPRIPDADRYWLPAGASWQAMRDLTLSVAYTHIFVDEGRIRLRDSGPGGSDFLRGSLNADYSASIDILSIQVSFAF
jgi:long-chain fatty acid transport protein